MKKVKVLLSAYNGEQYIGEQIESILNQTYSNIEIYVRDDGSTDNTVRILEEYENKGQLHLKKGENVGFIKSFFWLLKNAGDADYYAFSDQDDVWLPSKIEMALEVLEKEDQSVPLLYFSNYDIYSSELEFIGHADKKEEKKTPTFRNSLVDCMSLGFNQVFNKRARELCSSHIPKHSCGHDWWLYTVCQGMGKVVYDNRITVKYRRHSNNVSAGGMSFISFQLWRIKKFFVNHYFRNVRQMLREYEHLYKDCLSEEDRRVLSLFTHTKYNLKSAATKVFYPKRFRQKLVDEILLRIIFIIGLL